MRFTNFIFKVKENDQLTKIPPAYDNIIKGTLVKVEELWKEVAP